MGEIVDGPTPHRVTVSQPFERLPQCGCDSGAGLTFREQAQRIAELEAMCREAASYHSWGDDDKMDEWVERLRELHII
jgi:hypothetical protein